MSRPIVNIEQVIQLNADTNHTTLSQGAIYPAYASIKPFKLLLISSHSQTENCRAKITARNEDAATPAAKQTQARCSLVG
jgi:hypothetical protein